MIKVGPLKQTSSIANVVPFPWKDDAIEWGTAKKARNTKYQEEYCMMQQTFAIGSFASLALMILQQPWALPLQRYWSPMMTPSMMLLTQSHCGAILQIMQQQQLPFMFNLMAMVIPPGFFQQPFAGVPF
ncbi:hypothetical protein BAE44_0005222 [Dichanthelium oligosanthes]|uniref:Uncharacterized protein n=1 Tax=Dichanthelium oligosanthes TaxID=888268 RepID=A0A1E5W938_9POAL|nr:hypothetical protein BAE44_0005222 [Dichanthelium oligosanthes]